MHPFIQFLIHGCIIDIRKPPEKKYFMNQSRQFLTLKKAESLFDLKNKSILIHGISGTDIYDLFRHKIISNIIIISIKERDKIEVLATLESVKLIGEINMEILIKLRAQNCSVILTDKAKKQIRIKN